MYDTSGPTHTKRHGHRALPPTSVHGRPLRHPWSWSSGSSTEEFLAAWHKFGSSLGGEFQRLASNSQGLLFYRMQLEATTVVHSRRCTKKAVLGLVTTSGGGCGGRLAASQRRNVRTTPALSFSLTGTQRCVFADSNVRRRSRAVNKKRGPLCSEVLSLGSRASRRGSWQAAHLLYRHCTDASDRETQTSSH